MSFKYKLGLWMLRKGARIVFNDDKSKEVFKEKINADTWFGSFIETGNHLVAEMTPIDSYTVQSVINVLIHKKPNYDMIVSKKVEFYKDAWLGEPDQHKRRF